MTTPAQEPVDVSVDSSWRGLYLAGAVAAFLAVIFFRRNFATEMLTFNGFGLFAVPQEAVIGSVAWFDLLGRRPLLGLVLFDLFDLLNYALVAVLFLALYGALQGVNRSAMVAAVTAGLAGSTIYCASNQALAMWRLSDRYAAATTTAQQTLYLAAGEALLAIHNPGTPAQGTGITAALFLVLLAGLVISMVMWRSAVFNKATAVTGILANGLTLLHFPFLLIAPGLLWLPHTLAAPLRLAWYILIAVQLLRLRRALSAPVPLAFPGVQT